MQLLVFTTNWIQLFEILDIINKTVKELLIYYILVKLCIIITFSRLFNMLLSNMIAYNDTVKYDSKKYDIMKVIQYNINDKNR